jgi:hypothetical protein
MHEPPPKPKQGPDDLAEVERALSILQGRHPDHERIRREDELARQKRALELDETARTEDRKARGRRLLLLVIALAGVVLLGAIVFFGRREMARRARIDGVSDSFRSYAFVPLETSLRGSTGALETNTEPGCFLAVSTSDVPIEIAHAGSVVTGQAPALFCTCAPDHIQLTSPVGPNGGIALLRAEARSVGGSGAFRFVPWKAGSTFAFDESCADASLDAWVDAKRYPRVPVTDAWLGASPERAELVAAGFRVAALARHEAPLMVVDVPRESCLLVVASSPSAHLNLRVKGESSSMGEAIGSLGRCAANEATVIVSATEYVDLTLMVAPSSKVGGALGLREVAAIARVTPSRVAVPAADRAWDARQTLLASAVPEVSIASNLAPDVPPDPEARIAALSLETERALAFDAASDLMWSCVPELAASTYENVCTFSAPQKWRTDGHGDPVGGIARSKLPFWLFTMQGVRERGALEGLNKLLSLARRLGRAGFAPTTLEAIVELPRGVEVLGRTGEDAVVAVGVGPAEPWVYPLSDDVEWKLDGKPEIALVKPLEKIVLVTSLPKLPPIGVRRTVVFRRKKL